MMLDDFSSYPIGVLDSGIGGLTVLKALKKLLPFEKFTYVSDSFNHPFGKKNEDELERIITNALTFFKNLPIKMLVVACHTCSTTTSKHLFSSCPFPVLQILPLTIHKLTSKMHLKNIAVLATKKTSDSRIFEHMLHLSRPDISCRSLACQDIELIIEQAETSPQVIQKTFEANLKPLSLLHFDTIILGCTHFPIYYDYFAKFFSDSLIYDPSYDFAESCSIYLTKLNLMRKPGKISHHDDFFITKDVDAFKEKFHTYFKDLLLLSNPMFHFLNLPTTSSSVQKATSSLLTPQEIIS